MNKKLIGIIFIAAIGLIVAIQLFSISSVNNPQDSTIDSFSHFYYDGFNVYREGKDSLSLSIEKESKTVCCVQGPFRTRCRETSAGTLLTAADQNHDSLVSYEEFRACVVKTDENKDGFINDMERQHFINLYKIESTPQQTYSNEHFDVKSLPYKLDYNPVRKVKSL